MERIMLPRSPVRLATESARRLSTLAVAAEKDAARLVGMESERIYAHYNHTDSFHKLRWNPRESFQYMHERRWEIINDFYANLVRHGNGASGLFQLFKDNKKHDETTKASVILDQSNQSTQNLIFDSKERTKGGRWQRNTFKIILSYHGESFDGWQKQPDLNTVQGTVEKSLGKFVDEIKIEKLKEKSLPIEGCASVAGRTDKGVTALQQVCSFYTWRKDVKCEEIKYSINEASPENLTVLSVSQVSRTFHPNFSAKWRRYIYIFPLEKANINLKYYSLEEEGETVNISETKPKSFSVEKVDGIFRQLEGKLLSYEMFARDTQASRSSGPAAECFMFHSRAIETILPSSTNQGSEGERVMCVELIANRFLRKMVRVLVATAIREAAAGADNDALIRLMDATCRRATAPPAPPDGLCLVDVGYDDFNKVSCFILD